MGKTKELQTTIASVENKAVTAMKIAFEENNDEDDNKAATAMRITSTVPQGYGLFRPKGTRRGEMMIHEQDLHLVKVYFIDELKKLTCSELRIPNRLGTCHTLRFGERDVRPAYKTAQKKRTISDIEAETTADEPENSLPVKSSRNQVEDSPQEN